MDSVSGERTVGPGFFGTLALFETEAQRERATEPTASIHPLTGNRYRAATAASAGVWVGLGQWRLRGGAPLSAGPLPLPPEEGGPLPPLQTPFDAAPKLSRTIHLRPLLCLDVSLHPPPP